MATTDAGPILLELDESTWKTQLDRAEAWLGVTLMAQEKYRKCAEKSAAELHEPHIRKYIGDVAERARAQEDVIRGMGDAIGRRPPHAHSAAGAVVALGAELVGDAVGLIGGARGNWKRLRQLLVESQDAMGAVAIVEQLGYALGLPELADPAFRLAAEMKKDHLLIQEYVLEMAPVSILLHQDA